VTKRTAVSGGQTPAVQLGTGTSNFLATAPVASAAPSSYPVGRSERVASDTSWPLASGQAAVVVTDRRWGGDAYTRQEFHSSVSTGGLASNITLVRYYRSGTWSPWVALGNDVTDGRPGTDTYVGDTAPTNPVDGDLWISPSVPNGQTDRIEVASNSFAAGFEPSGPLGGPGTSGGWYRLASTTGGDPSGGNQSSYATPHPPRASARFILEDNLGGKHNRVEFSVTMAYNTIARASVKTIDRSGYSTGAAIFTKCRILYKATYDQWHVEVYCDTTPAAGGLVRATMIQDDDWLGAGFTLGTLASSSAIPALSYSQRQFLFAFPEGSESWRPLPYVNGWTDYNAAQYPPGGYMLDYNGFMHLRGMVKAPTAALLGTIAILPPNGYGPELRELNHIPAGAPVTGLARVDIIPDNLGPQINVQSWNFGGTQPTLSASWINLSSVNPYKAVQGP